MKRQKICKFCILERNFFLGGNYTGDILGHLTAVGQFQGNCITSQSGLGWLAGLGEPPKHWRGESGCVMSHLSGRGEIFDADNEISFSVAVPQVKTGPANPFWHQIDLSIVSPVASQRIIDAFFFVCSIFQNRAPRCSSFFAASEGEDWVLASDTEYFSVKVDPFMQRRAEFQLISSNWWVAAIFQSRPFCRAAT